MMGHLWNHTKSQMGDPSGKITAKIKDMALKIEETVDLFRPTGGTSDIEIEHNLNIVNCQDNAPYTESTFVADNDTGSDRNKMAKFELRDLVHTGVARLEIEGKGNSQVQEVQSGHANRNNRYVCTLRLPPACF